MLTQEMMNRMWPVGDSRVSGLRAGIVASAPAVFEKYGLTTPLLVAHAMAQFSHECGAGTEMIENLNYSAEGLIKTWPTRFDQARAASFAHKPQAIANAVYNGRMGNHTGTDDGWNFRGRGLSQTTGREGYEKLGAKIGLDLIVSPEIVNEPAHALECGVADFILCGCLAPAKEDDVSEVTHRLNGGDIGLAERQVWLLKWKAALHGAKPIPAPPKPIPQPAPQPKPQPVPAPAPVGFWQMLVSFILSIFKRT